MYHFKYGILYDREYKGSSSSGPISYTLPTSNMRSIIDTKGMAERQWRPVNADCCLLFAAALDYISHAGYPPATRGRMHVNANVYCFGTGAQFNRENSAMALPRPQALYP